MIRFEFFELIRLTQNAIKHEKDYFFDQCQNGFLERAVNQIGITQVFHTPMKQNPG